MNVEKILAQLPQSISFMVDAHSNHPKRPQDAFRKHDRKTPYWIHPLWCMSMCLQEATLPVEIRISGAQALAFHDIIEDTVLPLPSWVDPQVVEWVQLMTFESFDEETETVWERPAAIYLLKLFDKVSNLLDGAWMSSPKKEKYVSYTTKLLESVEQEFGELNITKTASAILGLTAA